MLNPEGPNLLVSMRQGESVLGQRVGEKGGIQIEPDSQIPGPADPVGEVLGLESIPLDWFPTGFCVDSVQVESVLPGQETEGLCRVLSQLLSGSRLTVVVACGQDSSSR